ncbi:MAG: lipid-A-disaccharide synthase [Armatimonadota bacterium]|nr:lipid-A-disaccharide synthase [Armatimonadota bacterium]
MPRADLGARVFFIAGEISGDLHGAELARALRAAAPDLVLEGVGGRHMAAAGVTLCHDSSDWGVMGWIDAFRQIRQFAGRLRAITARLEADPPDLLVPIDFSGFNLAVLRRVDGRIPAVYYVPPMVSVRRGRRAERIARLGVRLLTIFPFEAEAYRAAGADVVFVGHPAVELTAEREPVAQVRARLGVPPDAPVLGLLPGSRRMELDYLLHAMLAAARAVREAVPAAVVALALASPIFRERVTRAVAEAGVPVVLADGARDVMRASRVLLMASGTATVEAMVLGVPTVAVYRGAWLNWWIAHLAVRSRWATVPNIMAGDEVMPELLQARATPAAMAAAVLRVWRDEPARERMCARFAELAARLGPPGAARRAAAHVLAALGRPALNADQGFRYHDSDSEEALAT